MTAPTSQLNTPRIGVALIYSWLFLPVPATLTGVARALLAGDGWQQASLAVLVGYPALLLGGGLLMLPALAVILPVCLWLKHHGRRQPLPLYLALGLTLALLITGLAFHDSPPERITGLLLTGAITGLWCGFVFHRMLRR